MTDEKFVFFQDVREKKTTAISSHHKKTHAGYGGKVRMPSDYLTKKELKAMNGEVKSYRMNSPMKWDEFKRMPEDLQAIYIKALRDKYGASTTKMSEMFGCNQASVSHKMIKLGIASGRGNIAKFDKDGWDKFINGIQNDQIVNRDDEIERDVCEEKKHEERAESLLPKIGQLTFTGTAEEVFKTVLPLIGGANVKITVFWERVEDGE